MTFDQLHRIMMLANYGNALIWSLRIVFEEPSVGHVFLALGSFAVAEALRWQRAA